MIRISTQHTSHHITGGLMIRKQEGDYINSKHKHSAGIVKCGI